VSKKRQTQQLCNNFQVLTDFIIDLSFGTKQIFKTSVALCFPTHSIYNSTWWETNQELSTQNRKNVANVSLVIFRLLKILSNEEKLPRRHYTDETDKEALW